MNLVSITTGAVQTGKDFKCLRSMKECLDMYAEAGYRNLDLGFCHHDDQD